MGVFFPGSYIDQKTHELCSILYPRSYHEM